MGILNLNAVLKARAPGAITVVQLDSLAGQRMAIDISGVIYAAYSVGKANPQYSDNYYLQLILQKLTRLIGYGLLLTIVFDGPPPALKQHVIAQRQRDRSAGKTVDIPAEIFTDTREMIEALGLPIIQSGGEAEAHACALAKAGLVDLVATQDLDALAFGAPQLIRDIQISEGTATLIVLADVLQALQIDMCRFIEFCILLGCDYTEKKVPRVGTVTATEIMLDGDKSMGAEIANRRLKIPPEFTCGAAYMEFAAPWILIGRGIPPARPASRYLREWLDARDLNSKSIANILAALHI